MTITYVRREGVHTDVFADRIENEFGFVLYVLRLYVPTIFKIMTTIKGDVSGNFFSSLSRFK